MTHPFILERAKVLAVADHADQWSDLDQNLRNEYIAMAQAITDHDTKEGRKVVERMASRETINILMIGPLDGERLFAKIFDAAPAYPGGER